MNQRKLLTGLVATAFGMFGFGFALVPLYDVFCQVTGINGKPTNAPAEVTQDSVDESRWVDVEFVAHVHPDMPWVFKPKVHRIRVHPGEMKQVNFYAENQKNQYIVGQAIPSITPGQAAVYFHKTECFCFNQQQLAPLSKVDMPLVFYIDTALPKEINTLTLSYTLYNLSETVLASSMKNGVFNE